MARGEDLNATSVEGAWRNASGAELRLQQTGQVLRGDYVSRLGAARTGKRYALTGLRQGRCLGWSVSWAPDSDSLTSWTGLLSAGRDGRPVLDAMFLLVSGSVTKSDMGLAILAPAEPWEAFKVQAVRFERS